ncbi:uncharacterized protein LOC34623138 [Cyclospora cayetanensis]|uniref:Uncharacterized protein LOC34623138 n=1 Tax=Cyclospora cayetanensis TaxID=88456 RepID=A0A6P6RZ86_9EIME|nr:uncharacterized protein LOC34623138 [Cyclospora cayetanensis]
MHASAEAALPHILEPQSPPHRPFPPQQTAADTRQPQQTAPTTVGAAGREQSKQARCSSLNDRPDGSGNRILGLPRRHAPDLCEDSRGRLCHSALQRESSSSGTSRLRTLLGSLAGAAAGLFVGWQAHAVAATAGEGFSGSAAAVRLCPAAKYSPSDCSSRETPTGGVQIYKPAQIQAWQDFLRTQDGFVSLQILAQPPADYDSAAVAAEPEGEHSGAILLIERWRSHEARDAAEAAARTRIAQEGQEPQQLLLSEALAWPSRAYTLDSQAAAPLWLALR